MLEVQNISKIYKDGSKNFYAVKDISFELNKGETLSIVGDSGSGKSTIGQIVAGILRQSEGSIYFDGEELKFPFQRHLRSKIQILFQHPESAFNPRLKIEDSLKEPYKLYKSGFDFNEMVEDIERVGLKEEYLKRYPRELSGGEIQRFSIVRALSVSPDVLILDEPTSMLDVVSQAQIIHILKDYQREFNTAYIFITHNRKLSELFSDREIFLENGKLI